MIHGRFNAAYSWARNASYPDNITIGLAPLVFAVFGLLMVGVSIWRRLRPVYIVYMFLSWALAVSTSWWISVPRYVMAMFPMFMLFGLLTNRKAVNIAIVIVSGAVNVLFHSLFCTRLVGFLTKIKLELLKCNVE